MPLKQGSSKKTFEENLAELLASGKSMEQALAIVYDIQEKNRRKSK